MLKFEARATGPMTIDGEPFGGEHGVYAISSKGGNDVALLAVFGAPEAAAELAQFFNRLAQHFDGRFAEGGSVRTRCPKAAHAPASAGMTD